MLSSVLSDADLQLLRATCADAVSELDAKMEREGTQTLGINHKGKRDFAGQTYVSHPQLDRFLSSAFMTDICLSIHASPTQQMLEPTIRYRQ